LQESDLEKKMTATSGRKCLDAFGRLSRAGSWGKTFSELLIGTGDWYSTKCRLTWKLKGTKYKRMYFQLAPSTPRIDEIGYGLLPTPRAMEVIEHPQKQAERLGDRTGNKLNNLQSAARFGMLPTPLVSNVHHAERIKKLKEAGAETMSSRKLGASRPNGLIDYLDFNGMLPTPRANKISGTDREDFSPSLPGLMNKGLLPTPQAIDGNGQGRDLRLKKDCNRDPEQPGSWRGDLKDFAAKGMLPTPATRDYKGTNDIDKMKQKIAQGERAHQGQLANFIGVQTSTNSQLNPPFVAEMMGFPPNWTELPFLSGETNPSKPTETP
jgi:hypothetical protein